MAREQGVAPAPGLQVSNKMSGAVLEWEPESALWATLHNLAHAHRYNRWIVDHFHPYIGDRVLEVGCGIGNLTPFFLHARLVVCLDTLSAAVGEVQARWGDHPSVHPLVGDITDPHVVDQLRGHEFDTVTFVNVLEHIPQDAVALAHAHALLRPGGHVLLYVPALPSLFGSMDEALGHYRRYTREALLDRVREVGFQPVFCKPVNTLGALGWWFDGKVQRYPAIPAWQVRLFDAVVPLWRPVERALRRLWPTMPGLSLVCVARKP